MDERQFVDAMSDLMAQYVEETGEVDTLVRSLGINVAYVLATVMRERHLLPADVDALLTQFCQTLREVTLAIIRDEDAATE